MRAVVRRENISERNPILTTQLCLCLELLEIVAKCVYIWNSDEPIAGTDIGLMSISRQFRQLRRLTSILAQPPSHSLFAIQMQLCFICFINSKQIINDKNEEKEKYFLFLFCFVFE